MSNLPTVFTILTLINLVQSSTAAPKPKFIAKPKTPPASKGLSYPKIEATFDWPKFAGDPFDYERNDVRVQLRLPNKHLVSLPVFFDGGTSWRVRHTPNAAGAYEVVSVSNNGLDLKLQTQPRQWLVNGKAGNGFVKIDAKNPRRFAFSRGGRYYPIGTNQAWKTNDLPDIPTLFGKMKASGQGSGSTRE